jgi:hypothetical protein
LLANSGKKSSLSSRQWIPFDDFGFEILGLRSQTCWEVFIFEEDLLVSLHPKSKIQNLKFEGAGVKMDLKQVAKDTAKVLASYLTYQSVRIVVAQLSETNPPLAIWLNDFSTKSKIQDGEAYIQELLREDHDCARVSGSRCDRIFARNGFYWHSTGEYGTQTPAFRANYAT